MTQSANPYESPHDPAEVGTKSNAGALGILIVIVVLTFAVNVRTACQNWGDLTLPVVLVMAGIGFGLPLVALYLIWRGKMAGRWILVVLFALRGGGGLECLVLTMSKYRSHSNSLILVAAVGVLACLGPTAAAYGQASKPSQNLARNPSFEQAASNSAIPAEWHGTPLVYSLVTGVARTGKASLKYVNQDPQRYVLGAQKVPVQAGWKCRVSVWIKTQDIAGDETGATICLEWQGKDGKWLGGVYPTGIKGLSVEPVPPVTVAGAGPGWLHWLARAQAGKLYLFAVNDGDGEGTVAFELPAIPKVVHELGENRTIETDGATLQFTLPRLAVQCYEIEPAARPR